MLILAHRGASGYAPENTRAAFELARTMGAPGIETDVRLSSDGILVLVHDDRIDRTTDGSGAVADLSWVELVALDAGGWFDSRWAGERIVRLDWLLGWAFPVYQVPLGLSLCLEVKAPAAVDGLLAMLITRQLTGQRLIQLSSFNWDTTLRLRAELPVLTVGFLTPRFDDAEIERVVSANLSQICPRADLLTPELVTAAHARGLNVRAWGVQTREHLALVYAAGADGTTLNWPDWADETSRTVAAGRGAE